MTWFFTTLIVLALLSGYAVTSMLARRGGRAIVTVPVGVLTSILTLSIVLSALTAFVYAQLIAFLEINLPVLTDQLITAVTLAREKFGQI